MVMMVIHRYSSSILNPLKQKLKSTTKMSTIRSKTTSSQYVSSRARDPTYEKLMDNYKNLLKVISIQDLILANPNNSNSISLDFLNRLAQRLHLNRGAASFLRKFPHIFNIFYNNVTNQPQCELTETARCIVEEEASAIGGSIHVVVDRLFRLLSMSSSKSLPLRAVFKVWRELGLPDDFEDSVIVKNPNLFQLCDDLREKNTHILKLVKNSVSCDYHVLSTAIDNWRISECCKDDFDLHSTSAVDRTEMRFAFRQKFPPCMKLGKNFRAKVEEWQKLPYTGPYEELDRKKKRANASEKRAVAIVHEFLSLTVEKMIEVEKISHFRKWYGIDLNIRDLFLDHPGIFYLSTKGKRHTVFLREAYERGCLIDTNPVYDARRKLLHLVAMGRRGQVGIDSVLSDTSKHDEVDLHEVDSD